MLEEEELDSKPRTKEGFWMQRQQNTWKLKILVAFLEGNQLCITTVRYLRQLTIKSKGLFVSQFRGPKFRIASALL
jgi:hypothetical protein